MIVLCGGRTRTSAPPEPTIGFGVGVVVIGEVLVEVEPGVRVVVIGEVLGEVEPGVSVVVFGEAVVGNESLFEPPVVLNEPLDVVVFVLLLATSCLNGSPKLCV